MQVSRISMIDKPMFLQNKEADKSPLNEPLNSGLPQACSRQPKNGFLNNFYTGVRNTADMTDTIVVPRTIFKGYLGIMLGTSCATLGMLLQKHKKTSKALNVVGLALSTFGTWSFVRPFVIKDAPGVEKKLK